MDNYVCIDGVKVLLNDSQISEMRAILEKKETKKDSPFKRQKYGDGYYCITSNGEVRDACESGDSFDSVHYDNANYCTDEELLDQRALEEILARRLWRYSMEHDGDKIDWSNNKSKYVIYYDADVQKENSFRFLSSQKSRAVQKSVNHSVEPSHHRYKHSYPLFIPLFHFLYILYHIFVKISNYIYL